MGESFTIQISSNLIKQLVDDSEKPKKKTRKLKAKLPREPQPPQTKVHQKQSSDDYNAHKETTPGWPLQSPFFLPVPPPTEPSNAEIAAIQTVLKESEKVMEKLQKQEEELLQEVTRKAKELHDKEFKLPYQKPMPCLAENNACLECYKEHVKDPLKCAAFVKNFADCARRVRQQMSSAEK